MEVVFVQQSVITGLTLQEVLICKISRNTSLKLLLCEKYLCDQAFMVYSV